MYPAIKLMKNFKNKCTVFKNLKSDKKVKCIHSIMSSINTPVENLLLRLKVKSAVVKIVNCLLCVRLFDT